jgi:hypothetical protein
MPGSNDRLQEKAIPVTGRGDPYGCETSRLPHFPDNRFGSVWSDGRMIISRGKPKKLGGRNVLQYNYIHDSSHSRSSRLDPLGLW